MSKPGPAPPSARTLRLVRVLTVVTIVGAIAIMLVLRDHLDEFRRYAGTPLGLLLFFGISLVSNATLLFPVPGLALTTLVGATMFPLLVGIVGGAGQTLGELTGYMAGYSGQTLLHDNPHYPRVSAWVRRYGVLALFVLGVLPNPLFDIAGMTAGLLRMPVWQFLVGTGLGKILKNIVFAYGGFAVMGWLGG